MPFRPVLLLSSLFLLLALPAVAQIPGTISYQGVLSDPGGAFIPNGTHILSLRLYDSLRGGTILWFEEQSVVTTSGVFSLALGAVNPLPPSLPFDRAYFLGVSVDNGSEMESRTALTSVPYALRSRSATTADHLSPDTTGGVVRTGVVRSLKSSDGSITIDGADGPTANLTITDRSIPPEKIKTDGAHVGQALTFDGAETVWRNPTVDLLLPYTGTTDAANTAFTITSSGVRGTGRFINTNGSSTRSALYGEATAVSPIGGVANLMAGVEGRGIACYGVIGRGTGKGVFGYTLADSASVVPTIPAAGTAGYSDSLNGVVGQTRGDSAGAVVGIASGRAIGMISTSRSGRAGLFRMTDTNSLANAVEVVTPGTGAALYARSTTVTGVGTGILGESFSTANGASALSGANGIIGRMTLGGAYSAGVRGVNSGQDALGSGVIGYHGGGGTGVQGVSITGTGVSGSGSTGVSGTGTTTSGTGVSGLGNVGVMGASTGGAATSVGVKAMYTGPVAGGIALEINNGVLKVSGTNKTVFVHTTTAANTCTANGPGSATVINSPLCNSDPNAMLIVTVNAGSGTGGLTAPVGVMYDDGTRLSCGNGRWLIYTTTGAAIPTGTTFNVMIVRQ